MTTTHNRETPANRVCVSFCKDGGILLEGTTGDESAEELWPGVLPKGKGKGKGNGFACYISEDGLFIEEQLGTADTLAALCDGAIVTTEAGRQLVSSVFLRELAQRRQNALSFVGVIAFDRDMRLRAARCFMDTKGDIPGWVFDNIAVVREDFP